MNYTGINVSWEQKLMLFFIRTLLVNSFIAWRLLPCDAKLSTPKDFETLDGFPENLALTLPFFDFVWDVSEEVLVYANNIKSLARIRVDEDGRITAPSRSVKNLRRSRMAFFNTAAWRAFRLHSHDHHPVHSDRKRWCVLCRKDGVGDQVKHRITSYMFTKCTVPLCISIPANRL